MSSTLLYRVPESGSLEVCAAFSNSFRGAMLVWQQMGERYLGGINIFNLQPAWDLHKDSRIPVACRIVMASTFDNVMVKKENFERFIKAICAYSSCGFELGNLDPLVDSLIELKDDPTCYAVAWNQTSVNCDTWEVERPGEVDEYGDTLFELHDISRDMGHWFLFDELPELLHVPLRDDLGVPAVAIPQPEEADQ